MPHMIGLNKEKGEEQVLTHLIVLFYPQTGEHVNSENVLLSVQELQYIQVVSMTTRGGTPTQAFQPG